MDYTCTILENEPLKSGYMRVIFRAPEIALQAKGGQFVHIHIPSLKDRILRRPFSISNTDPAAGTLTVVYKVVGHGTEELATLQKGVSCKILGPLGNAYTPPDENTFPILAAGGYGTAALYLIAKHAPKKGILLLGARTKDDLILVEDFEKLSFEVRVATNDGSEGHKGFVTELLSGALEGQEKSQCRIYGCGPTPMLLALGKLSLEKEVDTELSLDQHMCCGVGACFACVVKVKDETNADGWRFSRSCKEGPVYNATEVYYG